MVRPQHLNSSKLREETMASPKQPFSCPNCGHNWNYGGKSEYYVTCPQCHYKHLVRDLLQATTPCQRTTKGTTFK